MPIKVLLKNVNSIELLLEEVVMHMHINHESLSTEKRLLIEGLRSREDVLVQQEHTGSG
jgi:hypothetical protein